MLIIDGFGDWSSVGCAIDTTAFAGNDSRVLCQCTHLTSFSILLVSAIVHCN